MRPPADKNVFLSEIASVAGKTSQQILLFDDDRRNVAAAVEQGFLGVTVNTPTPIPHVPYVFNSCVALR